MLVSGARPIVGAAIVLLGFAALAAACGARTPPEDCFRDADCETRDLCTQQRCVARKCEIVSRTQCDDRDPCTDDACDAKTGACVFTPKTFDLDGDGHRAPLPGKLAGEPGACGDDCDDAEPLAYPGNREVCDGVDNDCDGVVDNGARYAPRLPGAEVRVSPVDVDYAEPSTLARGGNKALLAAYMASVAGQVAPRSLTLDDLGKALSPAAAVSGANAAAGGATAVWIGDRYGVVWSDRRDGDYEVYFATLDAQGRKLPPGDVRITVDDGFSIYTSLVWTGSEFVVAWQQEVSGDRWVVEAQRLGVDGRLLGDIVRIASDTLSEQAPSLAAGPRGLGLAYVRGDAGSQAVWFSAYDFALKRAGGPTRISADTRGRSPQAIAFRERFVVSYWDPTPGARAAKLALLGSDAALVAGPVDAAPPGGQSREPAVLSLGDRLLAVYAEDRGDSQGFELWSRVFGADLAPLEAPARVTDAPGDSTGPILAFGHTGKVGVLFRDDRLGKPAAFYTSLACQE